MSARDTRALAPSTLAMLLERNGLPTPPRLRIKPAPVMSLGVGCVAHHEGGGVIHDEGFGEWTVYGTRTWT